MSFRHGARDSIMGATPVVILAVAMAAAPLGQTQPPDGKPGRDLFGVRDSRETTPTGSSTNRWGEVVLSNGERFTGWLSLSSGRSLELYDPEAKVWRTLHLSDLKQVSATVRSEELEKEWRWQAGGSDVKVFTGRGYPRRWLDHAVMLANGGRFTGHLNGAVLHVTVPPLAPLTSADGAKSKPASGGADDGAPKAQGDDAQIQAATRKRFILRQYERGPLGTTLDELVYVKLVVLAEPPGAAEGAGAVPRAPQK
jgi:hypothetical protein